MAGEARERLLHVLPIPQRPGTLVQPDREPHVGQVHVHVVGAGLELELHEGFLAGRSESLEDEGRDHVGRDGMPLVVEFHADSPPRCRGVPGKTVGVVAFEPRDGRLDSRLVVLRMIMTRPDDGPGGEHLMVDGDPIGLIRGEGAREDSDEGVGAGSGDSHEEQVEEREPHPLADEVLPPRQRFCEHEMNPVALDVTAHAAAREKDRHERQDQSRAAEGPVEKKLHAVLESLGVIQDERQRRDHEDEEDDQHERRPHPQRLVDNRAGDTTDARSSPEEGPDPDETEAAPKRHRRDAGQPRRRDEPPMPDEEPDDESRAEGGDHAGCEGPPRRDRPEGTPCDPDAHGDGGGEDRDAGAHTGERGGSLGRHESRYPGDETGRRKPPGRPAARQPEHATHGPCRSCGERGKPDTDG